MADARAKQAAAIMSLLDSLAGDVLFRSPSFEQRTRRTLRIPCENRAQRTCKVLHVLCPLPASSANGLKPQFKTCFHQGATAPHLQETGAIGIVASGAAIV